MNFKLSENMQQKLNDNNVIFKKANINEIDNILNIYSERMNWFKENNIKQWSRYLVHHPKEEFENVINNNKYFILEKDNIIIAGFEISTDSKFWKDEETPAFYIYKVVTKVGSKDIAKFIFDICKDIAKTNNKKYLRLDCLQSNKKLNEIYDNHGFKLVRNGYENENDYYGFSLRELDVDE